MLPSERVVAKHSLLQRFLRQITRKQNFSSNGLVYLTDFRFLLAISYSAKANFLCEVGSSVNEKFDGFPLRASDLMIHGLG